MAESNRNEDRTVAQIAKARSCLDRILASPCFVQSERQQRFLKFIVSETLAGHTDRLKGYTIAIEVFDRDVNFDPGIDALVRVEAARLRAKLREYYEREGRTDLVRFELPKGAYLIRMEWRAPGTTPSPQESPDPLAQTVGHAISPRLKPIEDRPSLAVLPFANMSSNPEQEYFADGITDGLIMELSRLPGLCHLPPFLLCLQRRVEARRGDRSRIGNSLPAGRQRAARGRARAHYGATH
jgi:hypothetical protein